MSRALIFRRCLQAAAAVLALCLVAGAAAMVLLPRWMESAGCDRASQALGRRLTIEHASVQPWRLGLVLQGVRVAGATPQARPLLELSALDVSLSWRSLLLGHLVVDGLTLGRPVLRIARLAPGRYDIDDLIARRSPPSAEPAAPPAAVALYNLRVIDGQVEFDDQPVQRRHELTALQLGLPFISTLASDVAVTVRPALSARLDGVALQSTAQVLPFTGQPSGRLSVKLDDLALAPLQPYLPADLPVRLQAGRLDLDLKLDFAQPLHSQPHVKLSGQVVLREFDLRQADDTPLLAWQRLELPLLDVQPLQRRLSLGLLRWQAPSLSLARNAQGRLVLPTLPKLPSSPKPEGPPPPRPWQLALAGVEVEQGRARWQDAAVSPQVAVQLEAIGLHIGAARWPLDKPVALDASVRWADAAVSLSGTLDAAQAEGRLDLKGLQLGPLRPYLPLAQDVRVQAGLDGQLGFRLAEPLAADPTARLAITLTDWRLSGARLHRRGDPTDALSLAQLRLDEGQILPGTHRLALGTLRFEQPRLQLQRDASGRLSLQDLLPAKPAPTPTPTPAGPAAPSWTLAVRSVSMDGAAIQWRDAAVPGGAALVFEPIKLQVDDLVWPPRPEPAPTRPGLKLDLKLAALGPKDQPLPGTAGTLQWQGRVGLRPGEGLGTVASTTGSLKTDRLPLQLFDAYLDPAWRVHLQRGELGTQLAIDAQQRNGGWQARLDGNLTLGALSLQQAIQADGETRIGDDLLSWQNLRLSGLSLALTPGAAPSLAISEAQLDDFFARLVINEQGRFNLRDVGPADTTPALAPATPALRLAVKRTLLNQGAVDFSDHFIRPNYSAKLSELSGSLGAFESGNTAMAPLSLRGRVAGTGLLEIDGQLNPSGAPLAMDVQVNASDIELAPLSPYAAKYGGYAVERGKLTTRLKYQIEPGGHLQASNQIILNQLTLGERVESPDATSLPVRLALALLKDRDGVIDVNLPVSGSINDPSFSHGGIIWRLIGNLIGKALTAPFALFSGGDSSQEMRLRFAPASAVPTDPQALDRLARLLTDRPGLQLTIAGRADPAAERQPLGEARLEAALLAEKRREPGSAAATTLDRDDRERFTARLYSATRLPNKPKNLFGLDKAVPIAQMHALLLTGMAVDDEAVRQLALARATAVRDALIQRGAPNARIFLAAPHLCQQACDPEAELSLAAR